MKYLQVILILSEILIFVFSGRLQDKLFSRKNLKIYRLDGSCKGRNVIALWYVHGVTINYLEAFCSNSTLVILEDYDSADYKSTFVVHRCSSRENLDSCEKVYSRGNMSTCQLINANNIGVSPLAVPYQPPITCPGKKGAHSAYNFTLNIAPFVFFPLGDWYWKLNIYLHSPDNTKLLGCGVVEVRLLSNSKV